MTATARRCPEHGEAARPRSALTCSLPTDAIEVLGRVAARGDAESDLARSRPIRLRCSEESRRAAMLSQISRSRDRSEFQSSPQPAYRLRPSERSAAAELSATSLHERARNGSACNHAAAREAQPAAIRDQAPQPRPSTQTQARPIIASGESATTPLRAKVSPRQSAIRRRNIRPARSRKPAP
jgi:hypothetical protein